MSGVPERVVVALAALAGIAGVALSAAAAHVSGPGGAQVAAEFLLFHAPALLAAAALIEVALLHRVLGRLAAGLMAAGVALFSGDLAMRALAGVPLAPMAAPAGGIVLMIGWGLLGVAGLLRPRSR